MCNENVLEPIIDKDTVIICTYLLDHMPKEVATRLLEYLLLNRHKYKKLIFSVFLDSSLDEANIPIAHYTSHYLRPFDASAFEDVFDRHIPLSN